MNKTESDQSPLTPGQLLLNARKEQDISVETIAQGLRLDPLLIDALENDEYEKFPAMAYVRGYLRGYANQVGVDPNLVVSSFDKKINVAPALEPFASRPEQQAGSGDKHVRAVTYSLIGVLALLVGLWWQTQRSPDTGFFAQAENDAGLDEKVADIDEVEVLEGTSGPLSLTPLVSQAEFETDEPKELEHDYAVVQLNEVVEAPVQVSNPVLLSVEPQETEDENIEEEPTAGIVPSPDVASEPDQVIEPVVEVKQNKSEGIVLKFSDASWIQITDVTGKKRFSRAGKPGEVVKVAGEQPFKVIIGKSSVVTMSYQGNSIDLSSLAKNEVARFYIDKDGAHK